MEQVIMTLSTRMTLGTHTIDKSALDSTLLRSMNNLAILLQLLNHRLSWYKMDHLQATARPDFLTAYQEKPKPEYTWPKSALNCSPIYVMNTFEGVKNIRKMQGPMHGYDAQEMNLLAKLSMIVVE